MTGRGEWAATSGGSGRHESPAASESLSELDEEKIQTVPLELSEIGIGRRVAMRGV